MNFPRIVLVVFALSAASVSRADLITFTVDVAEETVNVGGTVNWQLFATVSAELPDIVDPADNFGINNITADLADTVGGSVGETLSPATIGAPFADYGGFQWGGSVDSGVGGTNGLVEISATSLTQSSEIEANLNDGDSLGPLLFASGSYQAFTLGTHTLSASGGSLNSYFDMAGTTTWTEFTVNGGADTFTVTSVPEPSSISLGILSAVFSAFTIWRKRRRSAVAV